MDAHRFAVAFLIVFYISLVAALQRIDSRLYVSTASLDYSFLFLILSIVTSSLSSLSPTLKSPQSYTLLPRPSPSAPLGLPEATYRCVCVYRPWLVFLLANESEETKHHCVHELSVFAQGTLETRKPHRLRNVWV